MTGQTGKDYLKAYIKEVKPLINTYLKQEEEKAKAIGTLPAESVAHFNDLAAEGKGIRGCLVKMGYECNGGANLEEILQTSFFIELFHSGILVHDDFMDRDPIRRGVETLHAFYTSYGEKIGVKTDPKHYGNSMAVNVGDVAFYMSWEKLMNANFPPDRIIEAGKMYAKYVVRLAYGQILDITSGANESITEQEVLNILWTKSGEYTSLLPLMVGASLAGPLTDKKRHAIENYAKCFGWAFQIQDDYIGIFGEESETGKPITSDLREGKNTLFMVHLRNLGTADQLAFQKSILGNEAITKEDVHNMRDILAQSGTKKLVLDKGWAYVEEGKQYINDITTDPRLREVFESLLVFMMERTK